jgi:predicted RND superfamily exporter protein
MDRFSKIVTSHKKIVLAVFVIVLVISAVMLFGVRINYNIVDYLPADAQSTAALPVMQSEFSGELSNARVMLRDVTITQAREYKKMLAELDGVSGVMWLDDVLDITVPLEMSDTAIVETYYRDGNALIDLVIRAGDEEAVTESIRELIGDGNALAGDAPGRASLQNIASKETMKSILILVPVIIVILLLSTQSWLEPLIFLAAIGISIIINMGTNLFLGQVSFITNSVSPILQLAVSLDYAIFLLHSFADYRTKTDSIDEAMRLAMKRSLPSVAASAMTTLLGFLALVFMRFGIGKDLGINLAKGIVLSFVSVMVFLPALTLCCYKLLDKTRHKRILPDFHSIGGKILKIRIPALILIALIIVPCFLAQQRSDYFYGFGTINEKDRVGIDGAAITEVFGDAATIVLLVPRGDTGAEVTLCREITENEHVTGIVSYTDAVGAEIPDGVLDEDITGQFYSENYGRIIIYADVAEEGDVTFAFVETLLSLTRSHYGDDFYALGTPVSLYDMRDVVTKDNNLVNLIAIVAIFLVLLVTFRSLSLPFILLLTIEAAIWINLSVPYFTDYPLCYIGFLVINTVQLGATVDYAILLSDHYMENRKTMEKRDAMKKTFAETFSSILVSSVILSIAGFTLFFVSTNPIVSELGVLLGRGTLLSALLVVSFLPAMLLLFDGVIRKTTMKSKQAKSK